MKLKIQKTKFTATSPTTSWQVDVETMRDFILGASKITADGDCSHEIKKTFALWKESYDQPKQQKHYFANKVLSSQSYGFSRSHV